MCHTWISLNKHSNKKKGLSRYAIHMDLWLRWKFAYYLEFPSTDRIKLQNNALGRKWDVARPAVLLLFGLSSFPTHFVPFVQQKKHGGEKLWKKKMRRTLTEDKIMERVMICWWDSVRTEGCRDDAVEGVTRLVESSIWLLTSDLGSSCSVPFSSELKGRFWDNMSARHIYPPPYPPSQITVTPRAV